MFYFIVTCSEQVNSFQAVIATDGDMTFVLFLYQEIQWGRERTNVGFNSGNPSQFYNLPEAQFGDLVLDLDSLSNFGRPGIFAFRVDQEDVMPPPMSGIYPHGALLQWGKV